MVSAETDLGVGLNSGVHVEEREAGLGQGCPAHGNRSFTGVTGPAAVSAGRGLGSG